MGWERERGKNRDHRDAVADVDETVEPWRPSPGKVARSGQERPARRRRRAAPAPGGAALTVGVGRRRRRATASRHASDPSRDAAERLRAARASSGIALPDELAGRLRAALGAVVAEMRVHIGAAAAAAARALRAEAFTVGRDIYFAEGAFDPSSDRGERLIAHEAAHAASQPGAVSLGEELALSQPGDAHEREADAFAEAFADRRGAGGARSARGGEGGPSLFGEARFVLEPGAARERLVPGPPDLGRGRVEARGAAVPIAPAPAGIYRAVAARRASDDEEGAGSQDSGPGTGEGQPEGDGPDDRGPDSESDEADRERDGDASAPVDRAPRAPLADGEKRAEVQAGLPRAPGERRLTDRKQPGPQGDKGDKGDKGKQPPVPVLDADDGGGEGPVAPRTDNVAGEGPRAPQASTSGSIQFAPTDLSTLLPPIGPSETIEERRATERQALEAHEAARAHAVESLTSFAASSGQQADGMRAMQPGLDAQLESGEARAVGAVGAAASKQVQAVRAHVASAISLAEGAAASARAAVEAEHGRTLQRIEATTSAAKQKIDAAHQAKLQGIEQAQAEQLTLLGTLYAEAATKFRAAGTSSGAHAVSVAAGYASEYLSHKINRDDSFLDGPLTDNKCEARADAAKAVGESYRDGLGKEAEKQIVELNKRRPTDEGTVRTIADEARKQLQDAHRTTLEGLEAARKQSVDGAGQSRAALIGQIDNARTATVSGLNKHGRAQSAALQTQSGQIVQGIRQQRQQASVQIHDGIEQAIGALHQGVAQMLGGLSGAQVPDPAALDAALTQADEALSQQIVQMGQSMTQAAEQTSQMLDQAAAQGAQALGQAGAAAISTASRTLASARQSFSALQQSGVQAMQQLAAGHQQQCDASARAAETGFESIVTGLKGTYGKLTQSFRDGAQKNADAVRDAFMQAVDKDMPPVIKDEADAAAAKVQPRWKSVLKWVIIIAIILVVAIVIGPMVIGAVAGAAAALGATAGVASVVGAVVGGALVGAAASALTTVVDNAFSGRALLEGVAQAAMWGAIGGAVGGAVSSALGPAMKGMSIAGKVALSTATDVVVDTGLNAIQGNLSWESFAQGLFMSVLTNGVTAHPRVEAVSGRFEAAGNTFGGRVRPNVSGVGGSGGAGGGGAPRIDTPDVGGGTPRVDAGGGGGGTAPRVETGGGGTAPRVDGDGAAGGATTPKTDGGGGAPDGRVDAKVDGGGGQPLPPGQGAPGQGQGGTGARTDGSGARNDNAPRTGDGPTAKGNDRGGGDQPGNRPRTDGEGQAGTQPRTDGEGQAGTQPRTDGEGGADQPGTKPRTDGEGDADQPANKPREGGEGDANQPGGKGKADGEVANQPGGKGKRDGEGQTDGPTRPKSDQDGNQPRTDGEGDRTQGNGDRTEGEGGAGDRTGDVEGGKTQDPVSAADSDPKTPVGPGGFQSDAISLTGTGDKLGDAVRWLKPEPGKIDVVVHGSADGFYVLKDGGYVRVDHRALATYIKKNGGGGQDIRLISCGTGDSPTAIAQHLSNKLGVRVTAPTDTVWVHPDGRLTVGKNPTAETGGWNVFEPGTRPEVGGKPRADGDGTTPDVDTTPGARTDEGGGGGTRPPETDGTTPARTDDPNAPRAAGKDDDGSTIDPSKEPVPPADLPPNMAEVRKNLTGDAARQFDAMWARAVAQGKTDGFARAIEGMQKGKLSLEETLANQWQRANAAPKDPHGEAADQVPGLRDEGAQLQRAIDDARGKLPDHVVDRLTGSLRDQMKPVDRMANGQNEATGPLVEGQRANIRAIEAELRVALGESDVVDMGRKLEHVDADGKTHELDIDIVSQGGKRWIEVKNKPPFGLASSDWSNAGTGGPRGVKEQAELMVEAAKKNAVDGEQPEVVIDFPRGVSPEVADALAAMGVTVRGDRKGPPGSGDGGGTPPPPPTPTPTPGPGPVAAGIDPTPTTGGDRTPGSGDAPRIGDGPRVDGTGSKVDTTPKVDPLPPRPESEGISGGKVSREDFLGGSVTDAELTTARQQAQAERAMSLDEQAGMLNSGTARSEREMLLAIQLGETPRFIARVGSEGQFAHGTFANPNRPFSFATEPADLRGLSPAEALYKVGWTRDQIFGKIGEKIVICCLDTQVLIGGGDGGPGARVETGRMDWPELRAMALADSDFIADLESHGVAASELPSLFDLAASTPVKGVPSGVDAAVVEKLKILRNQMSINYGANELYTGMGATMGDGGELGGREVMVTPNGTGLTLTPENSRIIPFPELLTKDHFDKLFPPPDARPPGAVPPVPPKSDPSVVDP